MLSTHLFFQQFRITSWFCINNFEDTVTSSVVLNVKGSLSAI